MGEISRLGFVEIAVPDLAVARAFYEDVMGLCLVHETADTVLLRGWDEHDHHSVALTAGAAPGLNCLGFRVPNEGAMTALERRIDASGTASTRVSAGERTGLGEAVSIETPSGHTIYLYHSPEQPGREIAPPATTPEQNKRVDAARLDHVALTCEDTPEQIRFMTEVLGLHTSEQLVDDDGNPFMAFMYATSKCHDVVIGPGPNERYHHFAMAVDDSLDVNRAAEVLAANDVDLEVPPSQHGVGRQHTIYFRDPAGNRVETATPGAPAFPDCPPISWASQYLAESFFINGGPTEPDSFAAAI